MLLFFSTSFCLICGCDNYCNSKPDELPSNQALQSTAGRLGKFLDDSFNFKIRSTARSRQRWLSLFSLGTNHPKIYYDQFYFAVVSGRLGRAVLLFGGAVHTLAFKKAVAAVAASNLAPFFANALKALWLIDSTMLITSGIVFGLIAARPVMASSVVVGLLALMPAIVAVLLYSFIGPIMPAHLLVLASGLALAGALLRANA